MTRPVASLNHQFKVFSGFVRNRELEPGTRGLEGRTG